MNQRSLAAVCLVTFLIAAIGTSGTQGASVAAESSAPVLLTGTVVTMNSAREVIRNGHVLVRDGRIAAIWRGGKLPVGNNLTDVVRVPLGPQAYIYPGLIN